MQEEVKLHEVVFKPFSPSRLVASVQACLSQRAGIA
jgi:DNA-binding response OmpR family regulator